MKIFKEFRNWWFILIVIGLVMSYLFPDSLTNLNLIGQVGALFFGAFVFLIIPYIISIIIKKELKDKNFMIAYSISFAFTIVLYFLL